MNLKHILFDIKDGAGWIRFNRPEKMNALNSEVFEELERAVAACGTDDEVRVVVVTGSETVFVAGADIDQMSTADIKTVSQVAESAMRAQERLADLPKPTIAAISGFALGGGLEVALCCDFRLAAENAVIGLPEIGLGIIPGGGGTQRLPRLINYSAAAELVMTGNTIEAEQALRLGILNKVVPQGDLEAEVNALAKNLMKKSAVALRAAKIAMRKGLNVSLKDGLQIEQDLFCMLFGTEDRTEGMAAFLEKRKPRFKNR